MVTRLLTLCASTIALGAPLGVRAEPAPLVRVGTVFTYTLDRYEGQPTARCQVVARRDGPKETLVRFACEAEAETEAELAERGLWHTGCFALDAKGYRALSACPEGAAPGKGAHTIRWKAPRSKAAPAVEIDGHSVAATHCREEKGRSSDGVRYRERVCVSAAAGVVSYRLEGLGGSDDAFGEAVIADVRLTGIDDEAGCPDMAAWEGTWRLSAGVARPVPSAERQTWRLVVSRDGCGLRGALQGNDAAWMEPTDVPFAGGLLLRTVLDQRVALWLRREGEQLTGVWSDDGRHFAITRRAGGVLGVRSRQGAAAADPGPSAETRCALEHCQPGSSAGRHVVAWTCTDQREACLAAGAAPEP